MNKEVEEEDCNFQEFVARQETATLESLWLEMRPLLFLSGAVADNSIVALCNTKGGIIANVLAPIIQVVLISSCKPGHCQFEDPLQHLRLDPQQLSHANSASFFHLGLGRKRYTGEGFARSAHG